ncbi:MAG: DUF5703 family protein [Cellulomonadaceae bacterium]|jgi:hypothetical protein|nr:DUF5703 family protein [Cellulomonadaceae bacterium]
MKTKGAANGHYEYRVMTIHRDIPMPDATKQLTDEAEYGRWELARTVIYLGGMRRVWLRRKIIRVTSTL